MRNIILDNKSRKCSRDLQEHAHLYFMRNSPHRLIPILFWNDNSHVDTVIPVNIHATRGRSFFPT